MNRVGVTYKHETTVIFFFTVSAVAAIAAMVLAILAPVL